MDRLEQIARLKAQLKELRLTTSQPKKVNKLPRGCADLRYSRSFQIQAHRAMMMARRGEL